MFRMPHSKPISATTAYDLRNQMQSSSLPMEIWRHGNMDLDVNIPAAMDCMKKAARLGHKDAQAEFKQFCGGLGKRPELMAFLLIRSRNG